MYENELKRTPDKFYYNIYDPQRGRVFSKAFPTLALAESFRRSCLQDRGNQKPRPGIVEKIEEAHGWAVSGREFTDYNDALRYMWINYPGQNIVRGIFY